MTNILIATALAAGCILALLVTLCCGALLEVFRQLASVRTILKLDDRAMPLDLAGQGKSAAVVGIEVGLERLPESICVFLSSRCSTCRTIAAAFKGGPPANTWFILEVDNESGRNTMLGLLGASADRTVLDHNSVIAGALGLDVTPSIVSFDYGVVSRAYGVSSVKQVIDLLPSALPARTIMLHSSTMPNPDPTPSPSA